MFKGSSRVSGRHVIVAALILALGIPAVALGTGEGRSLLMGKRNPRGGELTRETEIISRNGTYSTRQSNLRDGDGGGAIYGCRSDPGREPCVRANNLKGGHAFQFRTARGPAGNIEVGDAAQAPFTTNATGNVTNLSADKLDGRDSAEFAGAADFLSARVSNTGTLQGGRGATGAALQGGPTTYIVTFNRDVSACTYGVTAVGGDNANKPGASVAPGGNPANVRVDFAAVAGPTPFHLQVIC
jgi:hypothetical protein